MTLIFSGADLAEDHVEFGLSRPARPRRLPPPPAGSGHRDRRGGADAVLLFEGLHQLGELEDGEFVDLLDEFGNCHDVRFS